MNVQTTKQALKITSKIGRFVKGVKLTTFVLVALFFISSVLWTGFSIYRYVNDHNFLWRSPIEIKFQAPLQIVKKHTQVLQEVQKSLESQSVSKLKVSAEEVTGSNKNGVITAGESLDEKIERAYQTIWLNESGQGTNKEGLNGFCIGKGGINEVGFDTSGNTCFKNRTEQHDVVILWFKNRLNKVKTPHCDTVEECLAIYNSNSYSM